MKVIQSFVIIILTVGREESWSLYCDLQIGCFNLTSVWYNAIRRPVNEEPWSRDQIRTMFSLYTREKPNEVQVHIVLKLYTRITATKRDTVDVVIP